MTPQQSHARAQIMLKHGEPGWRIESRLRNVDNPWVPTSDPCWKWEVWDYRAVRIEKTPKRTPLPIEHYKRGMEVRIHGCCLDFLVSRSEVMNLVLENGWVGEACTVTRWRWPNETEWHPAYTETVEEREVEKLEVEG